MNALENSLLTQLLKSRTLRDEKKAAQFYSSAGPPSGWFDPNRKSASGAVFLHFNFDTLRRSFSGGVSTVAVLRGWRCAG